LRESINYAQLRAFHAVASEGGFTRAAKSLGVTQPTLSLQVKELEASYGVKLFQRVGRGVEITELGSALYAITRRQRAAESEAEQLLSSARGLIRGRLNLAADAPSHVIPLLAAFARRYPAVKPSLTLGNTQDVLTALLEHRAEVAVLADLAPSERLHALPLARERLMLFVSRSHPWAGRKSMRLKELAAERLILREPGSLSRARLEEALLGAGVALGDTLEIGSREAVREAVAAGLGLGAAFRSELGEDPRLSALAIRDARIESTEYLACLKTRLSSAVVRAFFEVAAKEAGARAR